MMKQLTMKVFIACLHFLLIAASDSTCIEPAKEMNGIHLRVSATHNPPALTIEKYSNGTYSYKGIVVDIIEFVSTSLKATYTFINENSTEVAQIGEIKAAMNLALRREVDIISIGFSPTADRIVFMDFSTPLIVQPNRLVVPFPKEESRLLATVMPFQSMVWILLGVSFIVVTFCLTCVSNTYAKYIKKAHKSTLIIDLMSFNKYAVYIVSITANQGNWTKLHQVSFRIVVGTWCVMALVLVNAYSSVLISNLSVPKHQPILQSLEEVAAQHHYKLAVAENTIFANRILEATSGPYKILGDSLRKHPEGLTKKNAYIAELLKKMEYVYPSIDLLTHLLIYQDMKQTGKCRFTLSKPLAVFIPYNLAFPKNGPYTNAINRKLLDMVASGLINQGLKNSMPRIDQCRMENQNKRVRQKSLTTFDLPSAFAFWGLGVSLALVAYILEIIHLKLFK